MTSPASAIPVTYCTNIHPGESWAQTRRALSTHTLAVKAAVCPDRPFPVGLRVSGLASREIDPDEAARFKDWLTESGLYVATVNGFPFGAFHGRPVKSGVYLPDWREPARLEYTLRLARLLAVWLPERPGEMVGSISTVPVGFRADFDPSQERLAQANLRTALEGLEDLAQRTGRRIQLSVEPEPGCLVETTLQLVELFDRLNLPDSLRPYLAVCYDCCHQALQFENPACSLKLLTDNGINIGHVQVSSALHLPGPDLSRLARFDEPVYLHQSVARLSDGGLARFDDLGQALAACAAASRTGQFTPNDISTCPAPEPATQQSQGCLEPCGRPGPGGRNDVSCWRVHFHLPVFLAELPECLSTQEFLREFLPLLPGRVPLEVETYTFEVLPQELKSSSVEESIVREIEWVEACRRGNLG
jgi:sugar phosphate isomerase/epimerase